MALTLSRRFLLLRAALIAAATAPLAACVGGDRTARAPQAAPAPAAVASTAGGPSLGAGSVKVGLILPLTGPGQGSTAATSMKNAAELALAEFQNPDLAILLKDDRGTPEGAREAAEQAIAEGAELLIGPLFAGSVQAAGQVARQAGRPVIAFSTDSSVAARGVYLLSFLAQAEVDRVVDHAAAQGRKSFAALIPDTTYGGVVEAGFREAVARRGGRVVALERYAAGQGPAAVARIAPVVTGSGASADALFMPDNTEGLLAIAPALTQAGYAPTRVKPLGTGVWNDPRVFRTPALQGGWFAAPDNAGFNAFAGRYRQKFGSDPTRIATLSYDAVSLAAALARTQGSQRFTEGVLANSSGFAGADGVFRFKADGTNDRALAVLEVRDGAATTVSPAPRVLEGQI